MTHSHLFCGKRWPVLCFVAVALSVQVFAGDRTTASSESGHKGVILYVSKLGDNSDGSTWAKAFTTLQAALSAVPGQGKSWSK